MQARWSSVTPDSGREDAVNEVTAVEPLIGALVEQAAPGASPFRGRAGGGRR
jgi:hypothetical protein